MTAPSSIDPARVLHDHLARASPNLMRGLLGTFIDVLLSADADAVCGAGWGQSSPGRIDRRNGYRHRDLDTRVGTIDVAVPKLRVIRSEMRPFSEADVEAFDATAAERDARLADVL